MPERSTITRRRRVVPRATVAGAAFTAIAGVVVLACLVSLPWTLSPVDGIGGPSQRRFEATNLRMSLLPPRWWPAGERARARLAAAEATGAVVPSRWLGTDRLGRDVLARCLLGGAVSVLIGVSAAAIAVVIGTTVGMVAGMAGGTIDAVVMRSVDVLFGLPSILLVVLLAVAVEGFLGRIGADLAPAARQAVNLVTLFAAIGGVSWLTMSRVIRGQAMSLRAEPFIEACRAVGVPLRRQLWRHLLPNLRGPIVVYATLAVPSAILSESFLSFLGVGIREPLPSWGNMAADGLAELNPVASHWWLLLWPCLMIALTLIALNFLGEGLRERLDPRARVARAARATGRGA